MNNPSIPIIAIDGTSSSGKGTVARKLAKHFGYHYLNSGALYRLTAYVAIKNNIDLKNVKELINIIYNLSPSFEDEKVFINGENIWPMLSTQEYGNYATIIAVIPEIREALYKFEREMIKLPGLVADGRDMGTVVFKEAQVKIYLTATLEERAKRRTRDEEINNTGKNYEQILQELIDRDNKNEISIAGVYPATDAKIIDTSNNTSEETFYECLKWCEEKGVEPSL